MLSIIEARYPELPEAAGEFEIVLGTRQAASTLFLATVVLVVFCAVSYLGGKTAALRNAAPSPPLEPAVQPVTLLAASAGPAPESPLFADPIPGALYLQIASVNRGVALVLTEGLRKRGFIAFGTPGPTENTFRVLVGPLPDAEAFRQTQEAADQIGLSAFARRYAQ